MCAASLRNYNYKQGASWTLFRPSLEGSPQWLSLPRKFPALLGKPHWPGASIYLQKVQVHVVRKENMSLWRVDSSAQCLNSVQDWEGNLLLICSQHNAPRNRYFMQSRNDHTPCLGLCYCREHQNLKQSRFGGICWALLLCLLTLPWWMLWGLLVQASGLRIAGVSVEATDLYVTLECLWVFTK